MSATRGRGAAKRIGLEDKGVELVVGGLKVQGGCYWTRVPDRALNPNQVMPAGIVQSPDVRFAQRMRTYPGDIDSCLAGSLLEEAVRLAAPQGLVAPLAGSEDEFIGGWDAPLGRQEIPQCSPDAFGKRHPPGPNGLGIAPPASFEESALQRHLASHRAVRCQDLPEPKLKGLKKSVARACKKNDQKAVSVASLGGESPIEEGEFVGAKGTGGHDSKMGPLRRTGEGRGVRNGGSSPP